MQFEVVSTALAAFVVPFLATYWMSMLMGLGGLGLRFSRIGLPNGGLEARSTVAHVWRFSKLWYEATVWSLVLAVGVIVVKSQLWEGASIPALVGLAAFAGAAWSDGLSKLIKEPASVITSAIDLIDKAVRVWRRFKGDKQGDEGGNGGSGAGGAVP